ncbi:MAG: hypothetical protein ACE15D_14990 [Candidatus Eisenbacteria bacterium]|nr:hypothetical protein [Candidatus Eisenbacteria bacterium]
MSAPASDEAATSLKDVALKQIASDAEAFETRLPGVLGGILPAPLAGRFLPTAAARVAEALLELLDVPLPEILKSAWGEYEALLPYTDPKRYPPDRTVRVSLGTHTVRSSWKPRIELLVDGDVVHTLPCAVTVLLRFDGVDLWIRGGAIREAAIAGCRLAMRVRVAGAVLAEKRTRRLLRSGRLAFEPAVPIAPRAAAEASGGG